MGTMIQCDRCGAAATQRIAESTEWRSLTLSMLSGARIGAALDLCHSCVGLLDTFIKAGNPNRTVAQP